MNFQYLYQKSKKEISGFGKKPIEDVGKILTIVQSANIAESEVMAVVQKIYISLFQELRRGDLNQARQSWVNASGNNFEEFIRKVINNTSNVEGILAIKGDRIRKNKKAKDIVDFLTLKAKRRCIQQSTGVWPDSDVIALTRDQKGRLKVFALLNCKTSDHSRNDAVLFWALALRDTNIKYCLVTQDLDKKFVKGDQEASSLRRKCEAYLDRVYSTNPDTDECSQVRLINFLKKDNPLIEDLRVWRKEVVPDFSGAKINKLILN